MNDAERTLLGRLSENPIAWKRVGDLLPRDSARQKQALEAWRAQGLVEMDATIPRVGPYHYLTRYRLTDPALADPALGDRQREARARRLCDAVDRAHEAMREAQAGLAHCRREFDALLTCGPADPEGMVHNAVQTLNAALDEVRQAAGNVTAAESHLDYDIRTYGPFPEGLAPVAHAPVHPLVGDA